MNRYFTSRKPKDPEGGVWKVMDRKLKIPMCSCQFKEQAVTVTDALNKLEKQQVHVEVSIPPVRIVEGQFR